MFRLLEIWLEDDYNPILQSFYVDHHFGGSESLRGYEKYLDVLEKDKLINLIHLTDKVKCLVDIKKITRYRETNLDQCLHRKWRGKIDTWLDCEQGYARHGWIIGQKFDQSEGGVSGQTGLVWGDGPQDIREGTGRRQTQWPRLWLVILIHHWHRTRTSVDRGCAGHGHRRPHQVVEQEWLGGALLPRGQSRRQG